MYRLMALALCRSVLNISGFVPENATLNLVLWHGALRTQQPDPQCIFNLIPTTVHFRRGKALRNG